MPANASLTLNLDDALPFLQMKIGTEFPFQMIGTLEFAGKDEFGPSARFVLRVVDGGNEASVEGTRAFQASLTHND